VQPKNANSQAPAYEMDGAKGRGRVKDRRPAPHSRKVKG